MICVLKHEISVFDLCDNLSFAKPLADRSIEGICPLDFVDDGYLSFSRSAEIYIDTSDGAGIILAPLSDEQNVNGKITLIQSSQPRKDFIRAVEWLDANIGFKKETKPAQISSSSTIGENVSIEENVVIGDNVIIESNVTIHQNSIIGNNTRIRAGACIGGDGFGFERDDEGKPIRFIHFGGVEIGDNVEVGSNACICRGTFSNTKIMDYAKIDNLVHIAHNVVIGEGSYIIAGAGVAGSCKIGKRVWVGPNASIVNGITIGDNATIGMGAVVISDVEEAVTMAAISARKFPKVDIP